MAKLISAQPQRTLWVCLAGRAMEQSLINWLWDQEIIALLTQSYRFLGNC